MTCLANNDGLFDLIDISALGVYGFRGEIESAGDQPQFVSSAARTAPAHSREFIVKAEEDGERWDGLS